MIHSYLGRFSSCRLAAVTSVAAAVVVGVVGVVGAMVMVVLAYYWCQFMDGSGGGDGGGCVRGNDSAALGWW